MKTLIFASHPIQYQAPLFRLLAKELDLIVVYGYNAKGANQAEAGFGVEFEWDIPLLEGYKHKFAKLKNKDPNTKERQGLVLKDSKAILRKHEPDLVIVHGWFPIAMLQMIKAADNLNVPVWVRGDSNLQMKESKLKAVIKHIYFRWLFKKINGFLYVGSLNKALYKHYGVKDNKLVFAPHSIDTDRFREAFQAFPKPSNKKFTIGFVGKFIDKKNPLELVEAVVQLNHKEAIHLKWIGDGPLRHKLEKACKQHNLSFEFTGFLNQSELIEKGYANLDLMVLPSAFNETWGLVVNEVYCGNIPVITSDKVGCAPDMVAAVNPRLVYPSGQPEKLTSSIEYAMDNHKILQEKVAEISTKFSIQNTLSGYLEAINQN